MRHLKLLVLASLSLVAFGAFSAAVASAEDGKPAILCLEACAKALKAPFTGGESQLVTLAGKTITSTEAKTTIEGCEAIAETGEKDINLCKNIVIDFIKAKQGGVGCRSEMANGEQKDPLETILAFLDLHLAAEENAAKELQPLLLAKVLGALPGETELTLNCGGVKDKVTGTVGCLLIPGLKQVALKEKVTLECKLSATTHDPETGKCEVLCEWLEKEPQKSNLGAGFEDSGMKITLTGEFNKDIFIDD